MWWIIFPNIDRSHLEEMTCFWYRLACILAAFGAIESYLASSFQAGDLQQAHGCHAPQSPRAACPLGCMWMLNISTEIERHPIHSGIKRLDSPRCWCLSLIATAIINGPFYQWLHLMPSCLRFTYDLTVTRWFITRRCWRYHPKGHCFPTLS